MSVVEGRGRNGTNAGIAGVDMTCDAQSQRRTLMNVNKDIDKRLPYVTQVRPKPTRPRQIDWARVEAQEKREKRLTTILVIITAIVMIVIAAAFAILGNSTVTTAHAKEKDGSNAGANAVTKEDLAADGEVVWDVDYHDDEVTVMKATDEPIPALPVGWQSFAVYDRYNHGYIIIYNKIKGTFDVIEMLDDNGEQVTIPFN